MARMSSARYGGKGGYNIVQVLSLDFIRNAQCKVWMIEGVSHCYALCGVESKKFLDETMELTVDNVSRWDDFLDRVIPVSKSVGYVR